MRLYTSTDGYAETVDLDDKDLYPIEWIQMGVCDLFSKCMEEAGTSLFYMKYLHPGWDAPGGQYDRVVVLCKELSEIWNYVRKFQLTDPYILLNEDEYRLALMSWLWRFEDETENQC